MGGKSNDFERFSPGAARLLNDEALLSFLTIPSTAGEVGDTANVSRASIQKVSQNTKASIDRVKAAYQQKCQKCTFKRGRLLGFLHIR